MPEPVWLQKIRDRADKATPGPWDMVWEDSEAYVFRGRNWNREWVASAATSDDTDFIAHSRADVPRLIGLVGEMAGVLESFRDTNCQRMGCMQCRDDVCLSKLWGRLDDVLAKYRGEVENNG